MAKKSSASTGDMALDRWSAVRDRADNQLRRVGMTQWNYEQEDRKQKLNDFSGYLDSGNYSVDNNKKYRDMATQAVADLDAEMKRYGTNSNEYKTLKGYKTYYQNALPTFDRLDVGANVQDYLSYDQDKGFTNWHSQDDYNTQKSYLDQQRQAVQTELDSIEDQTSVDYQNLKSWQDQLDMYANALEERNNWDKQFEDANDFAAYERAGDYKNSIQARQTLKDAQEQLKETEAQLKAMQMKFAAVTDLSTLDGADAQEYQDFINLQQDYKQLQENVTNAAAEVAGLEKWQKNTATYNLLSQYGEDADYEQILNDLRAAREKAREGTEDWAKIDLQIRAIAGENEDGLNENGQYDDSTLLGRSIMRDFDVDAAQKRLDEIDQELKDLGVSTSRFWGGVTNADNAFGVDAAGMIYKDENAVGESDPRVMALRQEKTELTRKMNSAEKFQEKDAAETAFKNLSDEDHAALQEEGLKHISQKGNNFYRDGGYDPTQSSGMLENFQYLDDELGGDIRDMLIEAIGAEALGRDIGYTADDIMRLYQGDINHIAGKKEADKISAMDSDFARWNRQVLGVGTQAGLNQFVTGIRQAFSDDYIEPNKTSYKAQYTREDLKRYGDENFINGSNVSQVLFDTTQTTANMLPMIAASYLLTKAGAAPVVGELVGAGLMSLSSGGNTYQQALAEGWDKTDAKAYATILGAAEGTMQYLIGGISGLGGVTEDSILKAAQGINNAAVRFATETGVHILSETTEELAQNRLQRYLDYKLGATDDADWMSWNDDDWYTVIVTALSTGAMEGLPGGINAVRNTKLGNQLAGNAIPGKAVLKSNQARNEIIAQIGEAMKSQEALHETLTTIGTNLMEEGSEAYDLAQRMESGKAAKSAWNYGVLYSEILSEYQARNGKNGTADAMAAVIGGAIKYHELKRAEDTVSQAKEQAAQVRRENPGAEVLEANASALATMGVGNAAQATEYGALANKVLSGTSLTDAEMQKLLGDSTAAKATRVLLSRQSSNPEALRELNLSLTRGNTEAAKAAINSQIEEARAAKQLQRQANIEAVAQAAAEAADRSAVSAAAANAERSPAEVAQGQERVVASTVKAVQKADTELEAATRRLEQLKKMSFKELANSKLLGEGGAEVLVSAATDQDMRQQMATLQDRAEKLSAVRFPSQAQRTELADIREQQAALKEQIVANAESVRSQLEARASANASRGSANVAQGSASVAPAANTAAAPAEAAQNSSDFADTIVVPGTGARMSREGFVQDYMARNPGVTLEQANARFDQFAEQTGAVKKGNAENGQTADQNQERNDVGERGDRAEDQGRSNQSEQTAERSGAGEFEDLRTDGSRPEDAPAARVTKGASRVTDDNIEVITDDYADLPELTASLKRSGFSKITYILDGDLVNDLGDSVAAVYNNGELFLRLDYPQTGYDYVGTAEHERLHLKLELMRAKFGDEDGKAFVSTTLQSLLGREAFTKAFDAYAKAYGPVYLASGLSVDEVSHMICEEMLCDMVGGINNFGTDLGDYLEDAEGILEASKFNVVMQNLVDNPAGDPGTVIMEEIDKNALPYGIPADTLISSENVDNPSTQPADASQVSKYAFFGLAEALGFKVDQTGSKNKVYYLNDEDAKLGRNGFTQITVDMIKQSPIGDLIRYSVDKGDITSDEADQQYNLFASIASITDQTHDFYQAMQFMGSTIFTALKANSDTQYGTTYDFPSICTKTQAIINEMSAQMVARGRSLTEEEIEKAYNDVFNDGNPVPCPECYVFSRWVGIGGLLDNIRSYQERFSKMDVDEVIREYNEVNKKVEKFADDNHLSKGRAKGSLAKDLDKQFKDLEESVQTRENQGEFVPEADYKKLDALKSEIATIRSLTWIDDVYFGGKAHTASNVNPKFMVPLNVLYDLNEGETFARDYREAWAFRTTQGAGYGKAITPYAEAILGEGMLVTTNTTKTIKAKADPNKTLNNPYKTEHGKITDTSARGKNLKAARQKELNQLFIGGQRLQSTSDARFDNAVDYLLAALELQSMKAGAQVYTKVPGAVAFFNTCKMCTNMSMMPKGGGLDANNNPVDTSVGGMDLTTMMMLRKRFEYAGSITIGVNDAHIRALMAQEFRDFIIPYHASGGKMSLIESFRQTQDPDLKGTTIKSSDYTKTQSDKILNDDLLRDLGKSEKEIADIHKFRETRLWILTGGKSGAYHSEILNSNEDGITESQRNARRVLQELYASMQKDGKWDGVKLAKGKVEHQIFPNEFWDVNSTYENSSVNTQRYLDYCDSLGFLHRFSGKTVRYNRKANKSEIVQATGYDQNGNKINLTDLAYKNGVDGEIEPFFWKTLTDRRMYGNSGQYLEQPNVDLTNLKAETVTTFAAPMGERRYNHRVSMTNAAARAENASRYSLQLSNPGYKTSQKDAPVTDDRGQVLFVEPSTSSWGVARDADGSLLNTDYIKNELGMPIYDNPHDAYVPERRGSVIPSKEDQKHKTANGSTEPSYVQAFEYLDKTYGDAAKDMRILDASSGLGLGTQYGRDKKFNVTELEPFPGDRAVDFRSYGGLIAAIESGEEEAFDFIINNAVINVMAQDAREELLASLIRMLKPGGQLFINPAFAKTWGAYNSAIPLEEYKRMKENGEDVSKKNVVLSPAGASTGGEIYTAQSKSVQKGYTDPEFMAFARDVAKQALGEDIQIVKGSSKDVPGINKGFIITRTGNPTTGSRYSVQLTDAQQKNQDFNNQQTEVGSKLKTLQGTNIQRYKGIAGKEVSPQVYVHKDYAAQVVPEDALNRAEEVLSEKYPDFQYNTIMYDKKTGNIRFDEAPDFDTAREPIAGNTVTVTPDGETKTGYSDAIWHHKWLWVGNDYQGFNVADSWNWSKQWLNTIRPVDVSEHKFNSSFSQRGIANGTGHGTTNWNEQLEYFGLPKDENATPTRSRFSIQGQPATPQQAQTRYSIQDEQSNNWAPEFYSKMANTIDEWTNGKGQPLPPKMSAQQVLGWLKGKGVKSEEIKWSGIVPYLEGKKTVTKEELQQVMAENEIKIETKVLGSEVVKEGFYYQGMDPRNGDELDIGDVNALMDYIDELATDMGLESGDLVPNPNAWDGSIDVTNKNTGELVTNIQYRGAEVDDQTRWSDYTTRGGDNYREILFKQPGLDYINDAMDIHWDGELGVLAHARIQDMYDANGNQVLFVEEIQSDLHNAGANNGFGNEQEARESMELRELMYKQSEGLFDLEEDEKARLENLSSKFLGDSHQKLLDLEQKKRVLSLRLDLLADRLRDTLYDQSNGSLSVSREEIKWWLVELGKGSVAPLYTGRDILDEKNQQALQILISSWTDEDRDLVTRAAAVMADYRKAAESYNSKLDKARNLAPDVPFAGSSDTYHEYVMKHLLRLAAEGDYDSVAWTTADMQSRRWGDQFAEGYRIEYDQNLPKFMNKYGKQWGARVEQTQLDTGDTVWSVKVTPEMKRSVLETGQPLFSIQDDSTSNPYPENTLQHDMLEAARNGTLSEWVTEQMNAHEDALENAKIRPPVIPSKGFVPKVTAQEKAALETRRKGLIQAKGAMKPSEKSNGFAMPRADETGNRFRRFLQNAGSAEELKVAQDQVEKFAFTDVAGTYVPDSNKADLNWAKNVISEDGLDSAVKQFNREAMKMEMPSNVTKSLALGQQLLIETSRQGDMQKFLDVLSSLTLLSSQAGKSLQAFRMLKQSGPIGELYYVQKAVGQLNDRNADKITAGRMSEITVPEDLANDVLMASTQEAQDKAMDELISGIAAQVPVTLMDKWNAWRYMAMLGNARTHVRNIIGNAVFVPLRFAKDLMAAGGEFLATKAGLMEEQDRRKAISVSRELRDFAKQDALAMQKELQGSGKYNPAREILDARKILPGFLETISRKNGELLEYEDWLFLSPAYQGALSQALAHTGYSLSEMLDGSNKDAVRALNNARRIAIEEAQKATYRDFNAAASMLNRIKRMESGRTSDKVIGVLLEGILPFTKTPINILRRGVEYSPIGIASSIFEAAAGVKNGNLDVAQFIDHLSAGLSGTAVAVLGYLLASLGYIRNKKDDKEEEFDKLQGYQDYSIQIGKVSATIDWAAPTALPLFTGAAAYDMIQRDEGLEWRDAWDAMMMIAEPMMSLSMLDGLNSTLSAASYADDSQKLATVASSAFTSYIGQAFPTLLGQVARSIDGTRRSTYVDKNSPVPTAIQRFVQSSVQSKTPVWESQKIPYIDQWGREDTVSSKFLGAMENFLSPSYVNIVHTTDVDETLRDLYDTTKDSGVLPSTAAKYFSVAGERKDLTADEYVSYAKDVGSTKYQLLTSLFADPRYMSLTDDQKAEAVSVIYKYATAAGKYHIDQNYDLHAQGKWIEEAEAAATDVQRFNRIWEYLEEHFKK